MDDLKPLIRKYALKNAINFNGKAVAGNILGKVLSENTELKSDINNVRKIVIEIVEDVNSMGVEKQKSELERCAPELLEKKKGEKREGLKELQGVSGKVVMRMAPSPSGPLHIGHSYVTSLNYEYVKKYGGTFILRIEDTNPSNIYPAAYDLIPDNAKWLTGDGVDLVVIQSDRMNIYYDYALRLIEEGFAYVCKCSQDDFKSCSGEKVNCPCRNLDNHANRWHKMFTEYSEGEAVVRFKTDMQHKNPAMRDFPLFRINDDEHPRVGKKYRVWPLMNMSVAIDDLDLGVTHTLRGKDHADNAKRQEFIHNALGHKTPVPISVGRINFTGGLKVSCSKIKPLIDSGFYTGWDDIRLPFLVALRRRGYQPGAFRKYAVSVGVTKNDKTVTMDDFFKTINAFNKEIIDAKASRFFFVEDPVEVVIDGAPEKHIELDLHPEKKNGGRMFTTNDKFYLCSKDVELIEEGGVYRLMDCLNFIKRGGTYVYNKAGYELYKKEGKGIFHWLSGGKVDVEVLMPDNTVRKGYGEETMDLLEVGDVVQLERFGFCRLDRKDGKKLYFWFAHT